MMAKPPISVDASLERLSEMDLEQQIAVLEEIHAELAKQLSRTQA
ncbi:hypothetical protein [Arcanobacterium sp. S3PF19]|nr:hypothetical protein [Arcanobacterium sp. S3PF19]